MKSVHLYLAALVAILLQPLIGLFTLFPFWKLELPPLEVFLFYLMAVLLVAGLAVMLFGVPCFGMLYRTEKLGFLSLSGSGALIAALPYLVLGFPRSIDGYTANGTWHGDTAKLFANGEPMVMAWLNYAESALNFGIHGFSCGVVFYLFWRRYGIPLPAGQPRNT